MFVIHCSETFHLAMHVDFCNFALRKRSLVFKQHIFFSYGRKKQNKTPKQYSIFLSKLKLHCFILINDSNEAWGLLQVYNSSFHYIIVFHYFLVKNIHALNSLLGSRQHCFQHNILRKCVIKDESTTNPLFSHSASHPQFYCCRQFSESGALSGPVLVYT